MSGDNEMGGIEDLGVLVVDDDPFLRTVVAIALEEAGYTVCEAASADEALEILKSDAAIVSLIAAIRGAARQNTARKARGAARRPPRISGIPRRPGLRQGRPEMIPARLYL